MCVNGKYISLLTHHNNIVPNKCNSSQKFRLRKFDAKAFDLRAQGRTDFSWFPATSPSV